MKKALAITTVATGLFAVAASAQDPAPPTWPRFYVSMGAGAGSPGGDLQAYMQSKFAFRFLAGYRFHPNLQAEVGLDMVDGAANVDIRQQTFIGEIRKSDGEIFVPFGLRAILPLAAGRIELFAGGGGAYLHYGEQASITDDSDSSPNCVDCRSRDGWGYYGLAGGQVALDHKKRYFVGVEARLIRGHTSGDSLGSVPVGRSNDRWFTTTVNFGVRF